VLAALMPANATAIRVALHTGLRIGDVLAIHTEQLRMRMWVTEAKTGRKRYVTLTAKLLEEVQRGAGKIWAFPGRNPLKHRTRQAVWADVKRAARAFRFPQNAAPHSFRKVFAVRLLEKYGSIGKVKEIMNHRDITTTMIYALADKLMDGTQVERWRET